jgi:SH3-like domain-containing protein
MATPLSASYLSVVNAVHEGAVYEVEVHVLQAQTLERCTSSLTQCSNTLCQVQCKGLSGGVHIISTWVLC